MSNPIRLTQLAKRAGCAAKQPPGYLLSLLGSPTFVWRSQSEPETGLTPRTNERVSCVTYAHAG
jgi:hypothetical protein